MCLYFSYTKSLTACRNKLQSPASSTPFMLRTEERAAKRKQARLLCVLLFWYFLNLIDVHLVLARVPLLSLPPMLSETGGKIQYE